MRRFVWMAVVGDVCVDQRWEKLNCSDFEVFAHTFGRRWNLLLQITSVCESERELTRRLKSSYCLQNKIELYYSCLRRRYTVYSDITSLPSEHSFVVCEQEIFAGGHI